MNSDRFLGQDDEEKGQAGQTAESATGTPESAGATGIFGTLPSDATKGSPVEGATRPLPVVHSVVFRSGASRAEGTDELLDILRSPGLKAEAVPSSTVPPVSVSPTPARPEPVPASPVAASGGFTQLLRALNYEQPKERAGTAPAKAAADTSEEGPKAAAVPAQAVSGVDAPVTSFQAQPTASANAGSFTQLFESVAPREEAARETATKAALPGSFTQMFQALDAAPSDGAGPEHRIASEVEPVEPERTLQGPKTPGSFTQMFAAVSGPADKPEPVASAPEAPDNTPAAPPRVSEPASAVGSFTQMFRALDAAPVEESLAAPVVSPVVAVPAGASTAAPVAGSFTQMFQALDAAPTEVARPDTQAQGSANSGSFTQMLRTPSVAPAEAMRAEPQTGAAPTPGSFTQMFRTLDAAPLPPDRPVAVAGPPESDAAQRFAEQRTPPDPVRTSPAFSRFEGAMPSPALPTAVPTTNAAPGGLTQLLRALDQPAQTSRSYPPPAAAAPVVPSTSGPGAFTAMYGTLRDDGAPHPHSLVERQAIPSQPERSPAAMARDATQAFQMPQAGGVPQPLTPAESGPSEFTRILNASSLRESALRDGGHAGGTTTPPSVAAPQTGAGNAPPGAMPHGLTQTAASLPHAPQVPQMPQPHLPQMPHAPQVPKLPEVGKAPAATGMQQYLPLLLILVIFLLLAVLVAVIFLMKK